MIFVASVDANSVLTAGPNVKSWLEFIAAKTKRDSLHAEFNEGLWNAMVETVTVHGDHDLTFKFKDGTELPWKI